MRKPFSIGILSLFEIRGLEFGFSFLKFFWFRFGRAKESWCALLLSWLFFIPFHAFAAVEINPGQWEIGGLPGQRLEGNRVNFDKAAVFTSRSVFLDLHKNKTVSLLFSELEGVFLIKIEMECFFQNRSEKVIEFATLSPGKGPQRVRFDFTNKTSWNGIGKNVEIKLIGKQAQAVPPRLTLEPSAFFTRLAIFAENWIRPVQLRGLAANLFRWPEFSGVPTTIVLGALWLAGFFVLLLLPRFKDRQRLAKAAVIWSLALWITIDLSQKWAAWGTLERVRAMNGHFSDALGFLESDARALSAILKKNGVKRLNFLGSGENRAYLRFALLPARLEPELSPERTVVCERGLDPMISKDLLTIGGRVILQSPAEMEGTDLFAVYSGDPP